MRWTMLVAVGMVGFALPALAQTNLTKPSPGYTHFYSPGAELSAYEAAIGGCVSIAGQTAHADPHLTRGPVKELDATGNRGIMPAALGKGVNSDGDEANVENCMVALGWQVVRMDDKAGAALAALPQEALRAALANRIGATEPDGSVVRSFGNDLTLAATKFEGRPSGGGSSLSILAHGQMPDPWRPRIQRVAYYQLVQEGLLSEPVPPDQFGALGPNDSLIVVRVMPGPPNDFIGIHFTIDESARTSVKDRFAVHQTRDTLWKKASPEIYVFRVPPGRWRMEKLRSLLQIQSSLNLCLGSPSFSVDAGEVIFAGTFAVVGEGRFVPVMDPDPARQALAAHPALAARLKPAQWANGLTAHCGPDSYVYALEIPGAPAIDGQPAAPSPEPAP